MKTMPKLAHLTMFKDIVHCGSLHEAAKKLAISQPTLSRVLKELEMTVGARLLERSNRGVRLTAVGELFYRRIDAATNQLLNAFDELRGLSADGEKRLRVGMSVDPLLCYLPQVLEGFNRRYPHTRVTVVEDGPEGLLARLRNCELDLAVSSLNGAAGGADLAMQALKSERFSLYQGGDLTAARAAAGRGQMGGAALLLGGACRHPRDRRTLHAAWPDRRDRLLSGDLVPGQAARLYRAAERSGGRTLRPAAAPAENPDARDRHQRALLRLYPP